MAMSLLAVMALANQCAPAVAPKTLAAVVRVESGFDPLAIGVNGSTPRRLRPKSPPEAVATATRLLAQGANIDLGLGQINSANLGWLGLSVADAFDPCRNLAAAARVLQAGYNTDGGAGDEQAALRRSLSRYNTGDAQRGFNNGYVAKVVRAAAQIVPAIQPAPEILAAPLSTAPPPPAWDVFGQIGEPPTFVIRVSSPSPGGQP
jgi:type IV secretion system protein VirB1